MRRNICLFCGTQIMKSALRDPFLCRDCERAEIKLRDTRRYGYLDA